MSDPIFLRNLISNTVYAEQINSAQIQGQAAARERAARVAQEAAKEQATKIKALENSAKLDVDRDGRGGSQTPMSEEEEEAAREEAEANEAAMMARVGEDAGISQHIDLTV